MEGESARYDKRLRHDHLVCRNCGKLKDVFLKDITSSLKTDLGEDIDSYDLKIYWLCPDCRKGDVL